MTKKVYRDEREGHVNNASPAKRTHALIENCASAADRKRMSDDRTINFQGSRFETLRIVFSNRRLRASTRANLESLS